MQKYYKKTNLLKSIFQSIFIVFIVLLFIFALILLPSEEYIFHWFKINIAIIILISLIFLLFTIFYLSYNKKVEWMIRDDNIYSKNIKLEAKYFFRMMFLSISLIIIIFFLPNYIDIISKKYIPLKYLFLFENYNLFIYLIFIAILMSLFFRTKTQKQRFIKFFWFDKISNMSNTYMKIKENKKKVIDWKKWRNN